MVHHSRNHGYEFDAGYQVVFVVFSTTQLQQAVVLAPGDKARRYHGSSGPPAPPRTVFMAVFDTSHYD